MMALAVRTQDHHKVLSILFLDQSRDAELDRIFQRGEVLRADAKVGAAGHLGRVAETGGANGEGAANRGLGGHGVFLVVLLSVMQ